MILAATFLAGAKSRLLPPSIPLRFFASAAVFHVLMWMALFFGASQATSFRGGLGPPLAAVHLLTLGILTTTAIGAAAQLLPVATRRALVAVWPIRLVFWLTVPGIAALVVAMYLMDVQVLVPAAVVTTLGLLLFAFLVADNLQRAGSLPVVAAFGWSALGSLIAVVVLGLALAVNYETGFLPDHTQVALAHMIFGGFGFMGLLALGFSHVLIPMFSLSSAPAKRPAWIGFILAVAAVVLGGMGAMIENTPLLATAGLIGLAAAGVHLWLMHGVLKSGMRKRLGLSFLLVRGAWVMLPVTLIVGLLALFDWAGPNGATLFGFLLIGGWLSTFLFGILQRILPFLASMHVTRSAGSAPPLLSELASESSLTVHAICHGVAIMMVAVSIAIDLVWLTQFASLVGLVGASAFAWYTAGILRRVFVV